MPGVLDDYALTVIACLDAYEASADLSYFHFAEKIAAESVDRADTSGLEQGERSIKARARFGRCGGISAGSLDAGAQA